MNEAYLQIGQDEPKALTKERVVVGRELESADIDIPDARISRRHAELFQSEGRWFLQDLGSQNKTFINGKPLRPNDPVEITDGTEIHFGLHQAKFRIGAAPKDVDPNRTVPITLDQDEARKIYESSFGGGKRPGAGPGAPSTISASSLGRPGSGSSAMLPGAGSGSGTGPFAYLDLHSINQESFPITKPVVTIGTAADISIVDSLAAPEHAEIRFVKGGRVKITKTSDQPLKVNGQHRKEDYLQTGSTIEIGESVFTFRKIYHPEDLAVSAKSSGKAMLLGAVAVLVLLLGGGAAWIYWQNQQAAANEVAARPAVVVPRDPFDSIASAVRRESYQEAYEKIGQTLTALATLEKAQDNKLSQEDIELRERLRALLKDIEELGKIRDLSQQGKVEEARAALATFEPDPLVAEAMEGTVALVEENYDHWLRNAFLEFRNLESRARWDEARQKLAILAKNDPKLDRGYHETRLNLRESMTAYYPKALSSLGNSDYQLVLSGAGDLMSSLEKAVASYPQIEEDLAQEKRQMANVLEHARLLQTYNTYNSGTDTLNIGLLQVPDSYELRDAFQRTKERLLRIHDLMSESRNQVARLQETIQGGEGSEAQFSHIEGLLKTYNSILQETGGDNQFPLNRWLQEQVRVLQDAKAQEIAKRVDELLQAPPRHTLEEHLAHREKAYGALQLFPSEALQAWQNPPRQETVIPNPRERELFRELVRHYRESFEVGMLGAMSSGGGVDAATLDRVRTRLRAATLQNDNAVFRFEAVRNNLRS